LAPPWSTRAHGGHPRSSIRVSVRAAPTCDELEAKARSRFCRSEPGMHAAAPHFFYSRPVFAKPALDFVFVLLARLESRLLRRNSSLRKPLAQIVRMKSDVPLAVDHLRHARRGPQFSGKAELGRGMLEPTQNLAFLPAREFLW